jgi:hypothetical protein
MRSNIKKRRLATRMLAQIPFELATKIKWAARFRNLGAFEEELRTGARPVFNGPTEHWLSPLLPLSYTKVWRPHGVDGMNYISIALKGLEENANLLPIFNPLSPYYQAWFGVYALIGPSGPFGFKDGKPLPELISPLVVADQDEWQRRITGNAIHGSKFISQSEAHQVTLPKLAEKVFIFYGTISSFSALVPPEDQTPEALRYFQLPEKHLWNHLVEPRHPLDLSGFGALWADEANGVTYFAYGVGADFVDKQGQRHDYTGIVEPEVMRLLGSLSLRSLRG